jgi:F-type H+-transporting ATPase subunit delta
MTRGSVSRRYAKAVFAIGEERGNLLGLSREVQKIAATWQESEDLRATMANPFVDQAGRKMVWSAVMGRLGLSPTGRSFVGLIFDKSRFAELPAIARELTAMADKKENRLRAEVTSAREIAEPTLRQLKLALQKKTGKTIVLSDSVDEALIGGMVARVGDLMFDGSLRSQLDRIKENMLRQG